MKLQKQILKHQKQNMSTNLTILTYRKLPICRWIPYHKRCFSIATKYVKLQRVIIRLEAWVSPGNGRKPHPYHIVKLILAWSHIISTYINIISGAFRFMGVSAMSHPAPRSLWGIVVTSAAYSAAKPQRPGEGFKFRSQLTNCRGELMILTNSPI